MFVKWLGKTFKGLQSILAWTTHIDDTLRVGLNLPRLLTGLARN
jgi:hypothetical protein